MAAGNHGDRFLPVRAQGSSQPVRASSSAAAIFVLESVSCCSSYPEAEPVPFQLYAHIFTIHVFPKSLERHYSFYMRSHSRDFT